MNYQPVVFSDGSEGGILFWRIQDMDIFNLNPEFDPQGGIDWSHVYSTREAAQVAADAANGFSPDLPSDNWTYAGIGYSDGWTTTYLWRNTRTGKIFEGMVPPGWIVYTQGAVSNAMGVALALQNPSGQFYSFTGGQLTPLAWTPQQAAEIKAADNVGNQAYQSANSFWDNAGPGIINSLAFVAAVYGGSVLLESAGGITSVVSTSELPAGIAVGDVVAVDTPTFWTAAQQAAAENLSYGLTAEGSLTSAEIAAGASEATWTAAQQAAAENLSYGLTAEGTLTPAEIAAGQSASWMQQATSAISKATGGIIGPGGITSAGGALTTLAKMFSGGTASAAGTRYASGINPATGQPYGIDSGGLNAQSITGMLPYLALAALAVIALKGK